MLYKRLFFVVEGCLHGLVRDVGPNIAPQRQDFDGKTVSFSGSAPLFSRFRRFFVSGSRRFLFRSALRKTGAFSLRRSFRAMFARVLTADKGSAGDLALLGRCL